MRKRLWILFSLFAIPAILLCLFYLGILRFNYPSGEDFPIRGIDVSHHQGNIQWSKLPRKEVRFVFAKATEGGDFIDHKYLANLDSALKYTIPIGAYHFFTFCRSGEDQAEHFIKTVDKGKINLPPVIDVEYGGNCKVKDKAKVSEELHIMNKMIYDHYGAYPILYATTEFYNDYLTEDFHENAIWIRNIYRQPELKGNRQWLFWQYANRGHLKGIRDYVDMNVFKGSEEEFNSLLF